MVSVIKKYGFLYYMQWFSSQSKHNTREFIACGAFATFGFFFIYLWEQPLDSYAKRSVFLRM